VSLPELADKPRAILSDRAAQRLGLAVCVKGVVVVGGDITAEQQQDISERVAAVLPYSALYVERGFQPDDATRVVLLILTSLGGVLMLGGTLTATFLALSDARPDLATLSAIGAAPRSRRLVAAAYALVIGLVGSLLGAGVGFIPGIAITYQLTGGPAGAVDGAGRAMPTHFIDVPWGLVTGLVVALPLATAVVVGLLARSRLPLVARLG
jgi:putative ABC transport system permease protein